MYKTRSLCPSVSKVSLPFEGRALMFPMVLRKSARRNTSQPLPDASDALDDEALMARLQNGDQAALEVLFDRYSRLILAIGLRILRDRGEAEELVQEIFLQIFDKAGSFDPAKGIARSWIIQIAYHRAFDRRSYLGRRRFYNGTDVKDLEDTLSGGTNLEEQIAARLNGSQLRTAFEDLSEKQRTTLEMFFFEGCTLREISQRLDEPIESVRHHYYRGLARLRKTTVATALQNGRQSS